MKDPRTILALFMSLAASSCGVQQASNTVAYRSWMVSDTLNGEFVSIEDVEGLHKAIAEALVAKPTPLTGMEVRFLRRELDMSQKRLGELLGRDRQSIALCEKKEEVGEPYNFLLRHVYQEHLDRNAMYVELVDRLNELVRLEYDGLRFAADKDGWHKAS